MRYLRIFFLYFQRVFEYRMRAFIYFVMSLVNPLILIMFWQGASANGRNDWSGHEITSYYLLLIVATGLLLAHIEHEVGINDIKEGGLTSYLLKPFSYYMFMFMTEISFRILRSIYSITAIVIISYVLKVFITVSNDPYILALSLLIAALAFILSFTFKITMALIAFWITDIWGIFEIFEVAIIVLAGNIMPIEFYPEWLKNIALTLPFSYMTYFPIVAFQGRLSIEQLTHVIGAQLIWIGIFALLYKIMWANGIKKFTGVGQ